MTLCNVSMQTVELREEWTLVLVRGTFVYHVYFSTYIKFVTEFIQIRSSDR